MTPDPARPITQRVSPFDAAEWSASRAIRLFPTPAAPQITIPDAIASESAASMSPISAERPVQGHVNRIYTA